MLLLATAAVTTATIGAICNICYAYASHMPDYNIITLSTVTAYSWIMLDDVRLCESLGFSKNDMGEIVYRGVIPKVFKVSLGAQVLSPDGMEETLDIGLFRNDEGEPVNVLYAPCVNSSVTPLTTSTNLVKARHNDRFSVKARINRDFMDDRPIEIEIKNLNLTFSN